jgi:Flp pilus assembly protein CpaB
MPGGTKHDRTQLADALLPSADFGDPGTAARPSTRSVGPARIRRSTSLPSSRAVVGGLLIAVAMVAVFLVASGATVGPAQQAVIARRTIAIGHRLTVDDLDLAAVDVPDPTRARLFPTLDTAVGAITVAPLDADELIGRAAVVTTGTDLADTHDFSFPVDRERAVNGHLQPGETLDVLATYGTGDDARTEVVARGVRLLDLEEAGKATIGSNGKVVVTLAMTSADDVLRAAHASEVAAITLVRSDGSSSTASADHYPAETTSRADSSAGATR